MTIENKRAFTIIPTPELRREETVNYKTEIAKVCKIPVEEIKVEELSPIHKLLIEDKNNLPELEFFSTYIKYIGNVISDTSHRSANEKIVRLIQLIESLTEIPSRVITYGTYVGNYIQALNQYKAENTENSGKHRSLLVGALSETTVSEYAATVRSVFPNAECLLVDLEGANTVKAARDVSVGFMYADGFKLPFDNATIDVVHTSNLTGCHNGGDTKNCNIENSEDRRSLFGEFARVLKPGGIYVGSELVDESYSNFPRRLRSEMLASGFTDVRFNSLKYIKNRREVDRFFRGVKSVVNTANPIATGTDTVSFITQKRR
jgi:SAM-dependent methyltransferase